MFVFRNLRFVFLMYYNGGLWYCKGVKKHILPQIAQMFEFSNEKGL